LKNYKLKIVSDWDKTYVKPSLVQKMKGFNEIADGNLPEVRLAIEIPESIASELAEVLFGVKTNGRPVSIYMKTPKTTPLKEQTV